MTAEEYVKAVQEFSKRHEYGPLITFVDRFASDVEDQLTAEQVRILRVHLKHADMVLARAPSQVSSG